jgi:hypothetical protein
MGYLGSVIRVLGSGIMDFGDAHQIISFLFSSPEVKTGNGEKLLVIGYWLSGNHYYRKTGYGLRVTGCAFRVAGCELREEMGIKSTFDP